MEKKKKTCAINENNYDGFVMQSPKFTTQTITNINKTDNG